MQSTLSVFMDNDDFFKHKLGDVSETNTTSSNKKLDTKYNVVLLFQRIAWKPTKFPELYKEIAKIPVSSTNIELEDKNKIRIEEDLPLAIIKIHQEY